MASVRQFDFNRARLAQQLHAWGYPAQDMLQDHWGDEEGYYAIARDDDGKVMRFMDDEVVTTRTPWFHPRHYELLLQIQDGEWPDVSNV